MPGGLFAKYVVAIGSLVSLALVASGSLGFWFFSGRNQAQLSELHREKALAAASRIELYVKDIEHQLGWVDLEQAGAEAPTPAVRRLDFLKLLRQVPAITELVWADGEGRERLRVSRVAMDRINSGVDLRHEAFNAAARPDGVYWSPVFFRKGSEPYMTIARGTPGTPGGVVAAEVNLKFVWDVVSRIQVGETGAAFVVDGAGQLIAHPDISLVLRKTSLQHLPHVAAALRQGAAPPAPGPFVRDLLGREVISVSMPVADLGWHVFVEMPRSEALAPLHDLARIGALVLVLGLVIAVLASMMMARRMVRPVRALQQGATDVGAGHLDRRIEVDTGDEIQALADQFNTMSSQLRELYDTMEQKVEQRTLEATAERARAESASLSKTRFLAAASHDLRQPMHALSLYLGALATQQLSERAATLLSNARECAHGMDDLFDGLLDISRLDAQTLSVELREFPLAPLLQRIAIEFAPEARTKGLALRVAPTKAWVRSDLALVERILRNMVSNAVRYTPRGKVLVGCRRVQGQLRLAVYDTGVGIAHEQQAAIFDEFYQVGNPERDRAKGLGLGLSIVQRLAALLHARVSLRSRPGLGSVFSVDLPLTAPGAMTGSLRAPMAEVVLDGCLVLLIEDEATVRQATTTVLLQWGCEVVAAASAAEAIDALAAAIKPPDLILCDWRLRDGETGGLAVECVRDEFNVPIPVLIVSGDAVPDTTILRPCAVLHKPVTDSALRAAMARLVFSSYEFRESPSVRAARTA